jgi:glutamate/tyrosine decarboxylase-like PLP-dependent enzyme
MTEESTAKLLRDALERALAYLAEVPSRRVFPEAAAIAATAGFEEPFPESPSDAESTLELLDRLGSPATVASAGGRYFGFVNGGCLPASLAARILASAWDQNAALSVMSPVASRLRSVVSRWLADAFGLPTGTEAMFVGGATIANLCGLTAGRDHVLRQAGWDAAADGLIGGPPVTVVAGESAHSSVAKAVSIIGLGRNRIHAVPVDDQGRMRAECLPDLKGPVILSAQAGDVNTGGFDPFEDIVDWARDRRTSSSVVAQLETLIRIATRPFHIVPPHQQTPDP